MSGDLAIVSTLRDRIAELEERLQALTEAYTSFEVPGTELLKLTRTERAILKILHDHMGVAIHKERIHTKLYALRPDDPPDMRIIDVLICKIRHKLGVSAPFVIETKWGEGYWLRRREEKAA